MKVVKAVGVSFLIVGFLFFCFGGIKSVIVSAEADERIYTTAHIVKIEGRETRDPEFPIEYTTYVEVEMGGEKRITKLNTYRSSFQIGKQIDVYYFENDLQTVYETGSEVFYIIFAFVGLAFAISGAILTFGESAFFSRFMIRSE